MTEDENERFYGPFVHRDEKPPGGWIYDERSQGTWGGDLYWRTRHGEAVVCWSLGRPSTVYGAKLRDGTVLERITTASAVALKDWRRPGSGDMARGSGDFIHGNIEIGDEGVVFTDSPEQPAFEPLPLPGPGEAPNLEADLGHDEEFLRLIQDDGVAAAAFEWFKNRDLRKAGSESRWYCSFRHAAGFIAEARGRGETYTDFYPYGGEFTPMDADAFEAIVVRLGWHELTGADRAIDHARAMDILTEALAREPGPTPEWAANFARHDTMSANSRMINAIIDGKVSREEWIQFIELYEEHLDQIAVQEREDFLKNLFPNPDEEGDPELENATGAGLLQ